jgi:hypothetical protein
VSFAGPADKSLKPIDASRAHIDGESGLRRDGERAQLLSQETSAAVDSAFNTLAQTVLVQNARTLEDLVREMLWPMLKTWLDDNLPGMVGWSAPRSSAFRAGARLGPGCTGAQTLVPKAALKTTPLQSWITRS